MQTLTYIDENVIFVLFFLDKSTNTSYNKVRELLVNIYIRTSMIILLF